MRSRVVTSPFQRCTIADVGIVHVAAAPSSETARVGQARIAAVWALSLASVALVGATIMLTLLDTGSKWWIAASPAVLVPAIAGLLIALYRPANVIGWLLLADAVIVALGFLATPYAHYGLVTNPARSRRALGAPVEFGRLAGALRAPGRARARLPERSPFSGRRAAPSRSPLGARSRCSRWRRCSSRSTTRRPTRTSRARCPALPGFVRTALTPFWLGAFASLFAAAWVDAFALPSGDRRRATPVLWLSLRRALDPADAHRVFVGRARRQRSGPRSCCRTR